MRELDTDDFDRVHSVTAGADGERIVLTLQGPSNTNISLPTSEAPNLIIAICGATQMAYDAMGDGQREKKQMVFDANQIHLLVHKTQNAAVLKVGLAPGIELLFRTSREKLTQAIDGMAQTLGLKPASRERPLQ